MEHKYGWDKEYRRSVRQRILTPEGEKRRFCYAKPVHIGNDCWFGASVTVCSGVTIENRCIIGAGSVVTRDIPADSMKYKPEVLADNKSKIFVVANKIFYIN